MQRILVSWLIVLLLAGTAAASKYDIEFPTTLSESDFRDFIREAGAAAAYRSTAPAEPQGITGFDIGAAVSRVDIQDGTWEEVLEDQDPPSFLPIPRLQVRKGLPFNIDVGAFYAQVPSSNIRLYGGELQWALLEGSVATPALALRASYSTLEGVDDLDLQTYAADAVISKGFAMLTPYGGIGAVRIEGEYAGDDPVLRTTLDDQEFTEVRYFAGVQASLALLRLTAEAEYLERPIYTLKVSLGW